MNHEADLRFMREAIHLAAGGRGHVEPNPAVGAIVVGAGGEVVGRGFHRYYGGAHAEVEALMAAGVAARGGTLYVTLEPCSTHGKTPPCTEAIIASGVSRVVCAVPDPNPAHAGRAFPQLRDRGIEVEQGVASAESLGLLSRFQTHLQSSRPWVVAKWAMSMDGRIATGAGDSKWISCGASRTVVHTLRGRVDAIAVGVGTVRADNPRLTARPPGPIHAARIVFDDRLEVLDDWVGLQDPKCGGRPIIIHRNGAAADRVASLTRQGARTIAVADEADRPAAIREALQRLRSEEGVHRLLVEGGGGLLGAFFDASCVDQVVVFIAPTILGGKNALGPVGGVGAASVSFAKRLDVEITAQIGSDTMIVGYVERETDAAL